MARQLALADRKPGIATALTSRSSASDARRQFRDRAKLQRPTRQGEFGLARICFDLHSGLCPFLAPLKQREWNDAKSAAKVEASAPLARARQPRRSTCKRAYLPLLLRCPSWQAFRHSRLSAPKQRPRPRTSAQQPAQPSKRCGAAGGAARAAASGAVVGVAGSLGAGAHRPDGSVLVGPTRLPQERYRSPGISHPALKEESGIRASAATVPSGQCDLIRSDLVSVSRQAEKRDFGCAWVGWRHWRSARRSA
jgi:hypothetical protein